MRLQSTLLIIAMATALVPAACGTPGRRDRHKDDGPTGAGDAHAGGTVAYGADDAGAAGSPTAGATSQASKPAPATATTEPAAASARGARIDAMILTTRSVPPQYAVAITADVPTSGYDFGIDESRFDGEVLTIYLDLREPKRGVAVDAQPVKLTARFESGKRTVAKARVFVNVIRTDGSESGFELLKTVE
jgi:hypothetical protein